MTKQINDGAATEDGGSGGGGGGGNVNITQVNSNTVLTGAGATGSGSMRVTVAQDSTTVAGSSSLPAGTNIIGALVSHQSTNIDQIGGSALTIGQALMAASIPVTIASNQSAVPISAASLPLPTGAATSANQTNVQTAPGSAAATVINIQGNASGIAVPVSLSANQSVNLAQVNGVTVLTGAGATGTGSQRITVAQDSTTVAGAASLPAGTNVIGALSLHQSTNVDQINGTTILTGAGAVGAGSARVAVGQDTTTIAGSAPGTAGSASANVVTVQGVASMTPVQVSQATAANLNATVSLAAAQTLATLTSITNDVNTQPATDNLVSGAASATSNSSTQVIAAVASKSIWVTALSFSNTSATTITVAVQDGSGGTTLGTFIVPAGGGSNYTAGGVPLFKTTSGNGLYFAASTGETTIYVNASGFSK